MGPGSSPSIQARRAQGTEEELVDMDKDDKEKRPKRLKSRHRDDCDNDNRKKLIERIARLIQEYGKRIVCSKNEHY